MAGLPARLLTSGMKTLLRGPAGVHFSVGRRRRRTLRREERPGTHGQLALGVDAGRDDEILHQNAVDGHGRCVHGCNGHGKFLKGGRRKGEG